MKEYLIGFLIGALVVGIALTAILSNQQAVSLGAGGGDSLVNSGFARATATSTAITTASTLVFATTTNNQLIYRKIANDSATNIYCSASGPAVIGKGEILYTSSSIVFGASPYSGDRVVPTYGTVNCIAGTAAGAAVSIQPQ